MKLFASVNKKIKFREKDYIEKHYIKDDRAVIPVDLPNMDNLYMKHDPKRLFLSDEVGNYIKEAASIIPFKYDITLEFHCKEISTEEQDRIRRVIKNNFGMEIDDIDYERRLSGYVALISFILGLIFVVVSYALGNNNIIGILKELLIIAGWVIWWNMVETIVFRDSERKIERLNKLQLYDSKVEFIIDK